MERSSKSIGGESVRSQSLGGLAPAAFTETERRILALLARGHTVKSIAQETGWSITGINERLRNARRKSGVASSRELARLFVADDASQKIEPKKIDLAETRLPSANDVGAPPKASARPIAKGVSIMSIILVAALGATVALQQTTTAARPSAPAEDPLTAPIFQKFDHPAQAPRSPADFNGALQREGSLALARKLHDAVRSEPRDAHWAPRMEGELGRPLGALATRDGATGQTRVLCASALCEVAMTTTAGLPPAGVPPLSAQADDAPLRRALVASGFSELITLRAKLDGGSTGYAGYWTRKPAR